MVQYTMVLVSASLSVDVVVVVPVLVLVVVAVEVDVDEVLEELVSILAQVGQAVLPYLMAFSAVTYWAFFMLEQVLLVW